MQIAHNAVDRTLHPVPELLTAWFCSKVKSKGQRKIRFEQFLTALSMVAERKVIRCKRKKSDSHHFVPKTDCPPVLCLFPLSDLQPGRCRACGSGMRGPDDARHKNSSSPRRQGNGVKLDCLPAASLLFVSQYVNRLHEAFDVDMHNSRLTRGCIPAEARQVRTHPKT